LPFKRNLQRYNEAAEEKRDALGRFRAMVGRCRLNQVDP
jgi:hypothetical protein